MSAERKPFGGHSAQAPRGELSERQRQILELMRAGKVNKEIASELGIGLGTVKQHVVALFKKLNVRNRAMAVSRGQELLESPGEEATGMGAEGLIERRPCIVLSLTLGADAGLELVRRLHTSLTALAFDNDALFLARKGNAGDVIFGVQRVSEHDVLKALRTAYVVFNDIGQHDSHAASAMRGSVTAGLSLSSINRYGGWSGEAIASAAIGSARDLLQEAGAGQIVFGGPVLELMRTFGIGKAEDSAAVQPLAGLGELSWNAGRPEYPLVGRKAELAQLDGLLADAAHGRGGLVYLTGETGMGKSRLCREIARRAGTAGGETLSFRCFPFAHEDILLDAGGKRCSAEQVAAILRAAPHVQPAVLVVDDLHELSREKQALLYAAASDAAKSGRLTILAARKPLVADTGEAVNIRLGRMETEAIRALVAAVPGERSADEAARIVEMATGVPLFAVLLAAQEDVAPSLALLSVICARLDVLQLDRRLLRYVAAAGQAPTAQELNDVIGEEGMAQALDLARATGVLGQDADGRLSFTHPLLRQVIGHMSMN